jgi:basic amino acid/polyamine antiporter, APA family
VAGERKFGRGTQSWCGNGSARQSNGEQRALADANMREVTNHGVLTRQLGLGQAIVVGVGSMLGAGVFVVWSPAAEAAGGGLLVGLVLAGLVAFCNATSSAQLAALYPESGGTYVYGRARLGAAWGHLAGWGFVAGKTASCAAMALTVGSYTWPDQTRAVAVAAVVVIVGVNVAGLTRTVAVTRVLVAVTVAALAMVVGAGWSGGGADVGRIDAGDGDPLAVLRAGGFCFFAFAGYARIATLGEEVRRPEWVIPRAIVSSLAAVLVLYLVVGVTVLATLPVADIASTDSPLRLVVERSDWSELTPMVRFGAGVAALGVLLNLVPGVSRTALAMARHRDLPTGLAVIDEKRSSPLRAELVVGVAVIAVVLLVDVRGALGFSGVTVLTYYAITNGAALTLGHDERRFPRVLAIGGLAGCCALAVALPLTSVLAGVAVLASGVAVRALTVARGT